MIPYKEFISRRATDGHFVKANAFVKGNGRFIKDNSILSRPMGAQL